MLGDTMNVELVTLNITVPGIDDEIILEVVAAGISELINQHKTTGLMFTDIQVQENARLTMGDHICELIGESDEKLFSHVYNVAVDQVDVILATMWLKLEEFTAQVNDIYDIMIFWYPGLVRLAVLEKPIYGNQYSQLQFP